MGFSKSVVGTCSSRTTPAFTIELKTKYGITFLVYLGNTVANKPKIVAGIDLIMGNFRFDYEDVVLCVSSQIKFTSAVITLYT